MVVLGGVAFSYERGTLVSHQLYVHATGNFGPAFYLPPNLAAEAWALEGYLQEHVFKGCAQKHKGYAQKRMCISTQGICTEAHGTGRSVNPAPLGACEHLGAKGT